MSPLDLKRIRRRLTPTRPVSRKAAGGEPAAAKRPAAPKIVSDLYADLRDSHMLLPAAVLLIAIAAIPFLLGGESEPVPPVATLPPDEATATRVAPAVFAKQTGIRNYEKRLEALQERDPFKQQFLRPEEDEQVAVDSPDAAPDPSISIAGSDEPSGLGSEAPNVSVGTPGAAEPQPAPAPAPPDPRPPATTTTTTTLITYRVDVSVGLAGKLERHDNVRKLDPLPSKRKPVLVFLGVSENAKRATFLVSAEVSDTSGEGACSKSRAGACELVTMKPGESRHFTYGPRGDRYRLKLHAIVAHEKPDERK